MSKKEKFIKSTTTNWAENQFSTDTLFLLNSFNQVFARIWQKNRFMDYIFCIRDIIEVKVQFFVQIIQTKCWSSHWIAIKFIASGKKTKSY